MGSTIADVKALSATEGRLYFAGEACSVAGQQCVLGAFSTGVQAAKDILSQSSNSAPATGIKMADGDVPVFGAGATSDNLGGLNQEDRGVWGAQHDFSGHQGDPRLFPVQKLKSANKKASSEAITGTDPQHDPTWVQLREHDLAQLAVCCCQRHHCGVIFGRVCIL